MRASLALLLFAGCYEENWTIVDKRPNASESRFWGRVTNHDGTFMSGVSNYPLMPGEPTRFTVSGPLPVVEIRNMSVKAWLRDPTDTTPCEVDTCEPDAGSPTVELKNVSYPWNYNITFE